MDTHFENVMKEFETADKRLHNSYVRMIRTVVAQLTEAWQSDDWDKVYDVMTILEGLLAQPSFQIDKAS